MISKLSAIAFSLSLGSRGISAIAVPSNCGDAIPGIYNMCVQAWAPECSGVPQSDFKKCCPSNKLLFSPQDGCTYSPVTPLPCLPYKEGGYDVQPGGCMSVNSEDYDQCVKTNSPDCQGISQENYNLECPGGRRMCPKTRPPWEQSLKRKRSS